MAEKYELAEKDYRAGMKYKDIAAKYDVSLNTVKSWKQRKWSDKDEDVSKKSVHTKQKRVHTKKDTKEPVVESDELTEKQRLFCIYYIKYFNATKAYQKAYQCNYVTANVNGSRLLVNASIQNEIDRMKTEQTTELKLDVRDVIQKYIDIAFSDITDFVGFGSEEVVARNELGIAMTDDDGKEITYTHNFVNFKNADEVDGTILTEVKKGKDGVSVKLADKMAALNMLAKYTDLLSERELKQLREEKIKVDIAKTRSETKGTGSANINVVDFSNLSTEELRAIANSKR
ncbi:terminase small subunit [Psychrobacillus sp.]|uniref:terminase small subunit n=1 Tax=Psychrobacillus sp. TaxID=1871623 RepID=UPI0028BD98BB|nr:terminase small subunit [Psychrobacillus sp.]